MRRLAVGVLLTLGVGALPPSVAGAADAGFTFSGDCSVGIFFIPGDADQVQRFLPSGYTGMADPITRRAVLIAEAGSCSNARVDGTPTGPFLFGELLTLVGPPGHPAGTVYDFGAPTSSRAIASELDALGLGHLHLLTRDMSVSVPEGEPIKMTADVPWAFSPYSFSLEVDPEPAANPDENNRCCAWTEGRRGTVGGQFRLSHDGEAGELDHAGAGTLTAEPGSPLALMMGSETFTGPAFIRRFHFESTISLIGGTS